MTLRVTPEYITSLKPNEIFVVGSNLAGMQGGGAAMENASLSNGWREIIGQQV